MTLDEYQSTRWVCKAILCDQYKDCSVCPSWKNSNKEFEEENVDNSLVDFLDSIALIF